MWALTCLCDTGNEKKTLPKLCFILSFPVCAVKGRRGLQGQQDRSFSGASLCSSVDLVGISLINTS